MKTVLIVDDSSVMRQMVSHALESSGLYRCVRAGDGEEGVAILKKEKPDLIITDLNMPNMNGLEFISAIRAHPAHHFTPILLLTTETGETLRDEAKQRGATGWIVKPFNAEKLLRTMEKILP